MWMDIVEDSVEKALSFDSNDSLPALLVDGRKGEPEKSISEMQKGGPNVCKNDFLQSDTGKDR